MIERGLYFWAVAQSPIRAIIGERFYPAGEVPEDPTYPYAIYQRISTKEFDDISGAGLTQRARFQIDCWAKSALGAAQLADAFRRSLSGFRGMMGTYPNVRGRRLDSLADEEPPTSGQAKGEFRRIEQYYILYDEAA